MLTIFIVPSYSKASPGRPGLRGQSRGRCVFCPCSLSTTAAAIANAVQHSTSGIICYKCGAPGHIAPDCPHHTGTSTSTGPGTQRPRTVPPARGHAAAAQEGNSSTGTDTGSNNSSSTVRGNSRNVMVCMARTIRYESAMSARRILDCGPNPTLGRPLPQTIPVTETVTSGLAILTTDRFVTMVLPINTVQFNDFLDEHITSGLVPMVYMGSLNPINDVFWLLLHHHPLAEQDHSFAAIIYPESESERVINEGILPALRERFAMPLDSYRGCIERFCSFVRSYVQYRFMRRYQTANTPITVTYRHATICITKPA
jgi:hypothetical protein